MDSLMTREELQDRISYLERTLQRKAEQVAGDERAITKCDDEVNKLEITFSKQITHLNSKVLRADSVPKELNVSVK